MRQLLWYVGGFQVINLNLFYLFYFTFIIIAQALNIEARSVAQINYFAW